MQPAMAWGVLKVKLPRGLQMTSHLSNATTARDHKLTIPAKTEKKAVKWFIETNYNELQQANTEALK